MSESKRILVASAMASVPMVIHCAEQYILANDAKARVLIRLTNECVSVTSIGLPNMKKKVRTKGDMSLISPAHQAAKTAGDDHYRLWERNVADHLKGESEEQIRLILQENSFPFAVCFEHWIGDFNMGTGIRNANGFGAREVFYLGDRKWDKRAAVGVHNYTEVQWIPSIEDFLKLKERYVIVGIDNVPGSRSIFPYRWSPNTLMVFGEEGTGLTPEMQSHCQDILEIPMFGSVRSFNCGTSSGIVMYDYVQKFHALSQ